MSFVLKQNDEQIAISSLWHPKLFGSHTGTSYPNAVTQDYIWENGEYWLGWVDDIATEQPVSIKDAVELQIETINADYSNAIHNMVKDTPDFERESWPKQEAEAKAYSLDQSSQTPYIDTLAISRGVPRELLLAKILEKVSLYEVAHAHLTGLRQAKEDALKALPADCTIEDIEAITWAG